MTCYLYKSFPTQGYYVTAILFLSVFHNVILLYPVSTFYLATMGDKWDASIY